MKKRYIIIGIVLVIILALGGIVIGAYHSIKNGMQDLADMEIRNVNLSEVKDGTYEGSCAVVPIAVEVKVTVKDHAITDIVLVKHDNGQGKPAEILTQTVVEAQTLDVDVVSGATYSSKAILKAIENGLNGKG